MDPLSDVRQKIEQRLESFAAELLAYTGEQLPDAQPMVAQMVALTLRGGKRIRGQLLAAAAEACAPWTTVETAGIEVGAALEWLQSYLLLHDDWMDDDSLRRGAPTAHVALGERYGNARTGATLAILAGDLACALAQQTVMQAAAPVDRVGAMGAVFAEIQRDVVLGQTLDVLGSEDVDRMRQLKTGSYTVRGPLALGHALANGTAAALVVLRAFGEPIGLAFQLRDDVLGVVGDHVRTGKHARSDLNPARRNAVVMAALATMDDRRRADFDRLCRSTDDASVADAQAIVAESGAVHTVETRIAHACAQAIDALKDGSLRPSGVALLERLAHAICERVS